MNIVNRECAEHLAHDVCVSPDLYRKPPCPPRRPSMQVLLATVGLFAFGLGLVVYPSKNALNFPGNTEHPLWHKEDASLIEQGAQTTSLSDATTKAALGTVAPETELDKNEGKATTTVVPSNANDDRIDLLVEASELKQQFRGSDKVLSKKERNLKPIAKGKKIKKRTGKQKKVKAAKKKALSTISASSSLVLATITIPSPMPTASPLPTSSPTSLSFTPNASWEYGLSFAASGGQSAEILPQSGSGPMNVVCGAVQAVLAHPTNPDICLAAGVNGGVWRTFTCREDLPNWEPLTDNEESLSVGDMVFDKSDPTFNTVLVGIGTRSSFAFAGGPAIGFLYTTNALVPSPGTVTWTVLDNAAGTIKFRNRQVKFNSVFARGSLMLASAYDANPNTCEYRGIFRSIDKGVTWTNVFESLGRAIASDPNDPKRFYAIVDEADSCTPTAGKPNGVLTSTDQGATWTFTSSIVTLASGELNNGKLSVSDNSRVWSALLKNGRDATISYSDNRGTTWTTMDKILLPDSQNDFDDGLNPVEKPGSQGEKHFALLASKTDANEVYVGGDRQDVLFGTSFPSTPNYIGAIDFNGAIWRANASVSATNANPSPQWEHMTHGNDIDDIPEGGTTWSSAPHADCRDMELRADGYILEASDGGITVRSSPSTNTGDWFGVCGTMDVFESHSVAYEPVFQTVLFGSQDNSNVLGLLGSPNTFEVLAAADGSDVMIDWKSDPNFVYYYHGSQNLNSFRRQAASKTSGVLGNATLLQNNLPFGRGTASFVSVTAMNPNNQQQFVVAVGIQPTTKNVIAFTTNRGDTFLEYSSGLTATIEAFIWTADGATLYAASGFGQFASCTNTGVALSCAVRPPIRSIPSFIHQLAVNPTNSNMVFAVATDGSRNYLNPRAFFTPNGGTTWTEITVTGSLLDTSTMGSSVAYIQNGDFGTVAYGTSNGVLIPNGGLGVGWKLIATGLPNVIIMDMVYDETDDRLVIATLGRGIWYLEFASLVAQGMIPSSTEDPAFTQGAIRRRRHLDRDGSSWPSVDDDPRQPPDDAPDEYISMDFGVPTV